MPQTQTVLEKVEVNLLTGQTIVQWRNRLVADNGALLVNEPVRVALDPQRFAADGVTLLPPADLAATIANVDTQLAAFGWPATAPSDKAAIASHDAQRLAVVPVKPVKGNPNV